ncbi:MAG TPA: NAD(P)H-dependent oxidoreductase subunit E [Chloroflexi bacterium]|nr:MAG: NAD(P)H-dependent oxidoreductase subunit E [Chloroflexota bacterium]HDD55558.1 NAD(P)H-dependent oxidoreductase subunit E [Chloroflexota bacterium]
MTVTDIDIGLIEPILQEFREQKGAVIPILQRTQDIYGYLPEDAMVEISKKSGISISQLYGVATFYAQFNLEPRGRHLIQICDGTACHVKGAQKLVEAVENGFDLEAGGSDPDFEYTLEIVYCLGSCGLAPIALVDGQVYGNTTADSIVKNIKELD